VTHHPSSPFQEIPLYIPQAQAKALPVCEPGSDETKRGMTTGQAKKILWFAE